MKKYSIIGVILTLIALVAFTVLITKMTNSVIVGIVGGVFMTLFACRPAKEDGEFLWHKR